MKMSIITAALAAALPFLGFTAAAQSAFHPSVPGRTVTYANTGEEGEVRNYLVETVTDADLSAGVYTYSYVFLDSEKRPVFKRGETLVMMCDLSGENADVTMNDISKALKADAFLPHGNLSSIPDEIAVEDTLPDCRVGIKVSFYKNGSEFRNRVVTGSETVAIGEESYDCFVIEEDEYYLGALEPNRVKTWVCKGVGLVRQEVYAPSGKFVKRLERVAR